MIRLIQLQHERLGRRVARVSGERLECLNAPGSIYELAWAALQRRVPLREAITISTVSETLAYEPIY